jgi:hypothetical protein
MNETTTTSNPTTTSPAERGLYGSCPDTIDGSHDWLTFERPAWTHNGDSSTVTAPAHSGAVCNWCGLTR